MRFLFGDGTVGRQNNVVVNDQRGRRPGGTGAGPRPALREQPEEGQTPLPRVPRQDAAFEIRARRGSRCPRIQLEKTAKAPAGRRFQVTKHKKRIF